MTSFVGECGKNHWSVKMASCSFIHKDRLTRQLVSCPHVYKPRRGTYKLHKHSGALWGGNDSSRISWYSIQFTGNPWSHSRLQDIILKKEHSHHCWWMITSPTLTVWRQTSSLPNFLLHGSFLHFKATWFQEAVSSQRLCDSLPDRVGSDEVRMHTSFCVEISAETKVNTLCSLLT